MEGRHQHPQCQRHRPIPGRRGPRRSLRNQRLDQPARPRVLHLERFRTFHDNSDCSRRLSERSFRFFIVGALGLFKHRHHRHQFTRHSRHRQRRLRRQLRFGRHRPGHHHPPSATIRHCRRVGHLHRRRQRHLATHLSLAEKYGESRHARQPIRRQSHAFAYESGARRRGKLRLHRHQHPRLRHQQSRLAISHHCAARRPGDHHPTRQPNGDRGHQRHVLRRRLRHRDADLSMEIRHREPLR